MTTKKEIFDQIKEYSKDKRFAYAYIFGYLLDANNGFNKFSKKTLKHCLNSMKEEKGSLI